MGYGTTAHNRIVCAAPPTAAWPTKNRSRPTAFVRFFVGTFCPPLELLRNSFIAAVKTSHTTGTLYAMGAKIGWNILYKNYMKRT
jgi:hypothetical protein